MNGWPTEYLYAIAAMVGILAISRWLAMRRWAGADQIANDADQLLHTGSVSAILVGDQPPAGFEDIAL